MAFVAIGRSPAKAFVLCKMVARAGQIGMEADLDTGAKRLVP
jgi:hypothetical protein